jgi:hypothetical protein
MRTIPLSSLVLLLGAPRVSAEETSAGALVAPLLEPPPVIDGVQGAAADMKRTLAQTSESMERS